MEMTIPATLANLDKVSAFTEEYLESIDCPMKLMMKLSVAMEEIYVNVAHYAYPGENADGTGMVTVTFDHDPAQNLLTVVFKDQGIPFNPLEKEDPDVTASAEDRAIGGLGIFMVRKTMDDMAYSYEDGSNILTMKKHLA